MTILRALVVEIYVELSDVEVYFCDVVLCWLVDRQAYQYFKGTCCIHLEVGCPEGEGRKLLCKPNL